MQILIGGGMATIYALLIVFVLYCIISDWFMHEYEEGLSFKNFNKFKIGSFFSHQVNTLKPLKKLVRLVNLNEDNLAKQPIFWIGIILPLVVAGWAEYNIILLNPNFLSFKEIKNFYEASTPALYITALTPTLGILISNIHKSIQTEKEIISSEAKNIIDLFYAHYEYTTEEFRRLDDKKNRLIVMNPNHLYRKVFPSASYLNGIGEKSMLFINELLFNTNKLNEIINEMNLNSLSINEENKTENFIDALMRLDEDKLSSIDTYKNKIFKLLEVEMSSKFRGNFDVYNTYIRYSEEGFKNPYFDDEYEQADEQQNWHILEYPDLIAEDYTLDNANDFLKKISQTFKMIHFLVNKILDILDSRDKQSLLHLNNLRTSANLVDSISNLINARQNDIANEINGQ